MANRAATIQHLTNAEQWHISSEQNPADLVSRGLDASSLHNNSLWWNGPTFLATKDFPERNILSSVTDSDEFNCEFKSSQQIAEEKKGGPLDVQEINRAETTLIRIVQLQEFKRDIKSLKENNRVSAESLIKCLNQFLGKDGVLRVGGRLCNSDLNFECKFPIILPCNHKLTNLIVEYFHLKYFHLGPQALLYQELMPNSRDCTSLVINPDPELSGFLENENINCKFLPPRAPNFDGLWEAGVKSFKFHFKREAGNSRFTYEEFLTMMTQIEGILNSCPLTPLSTDIDDLSVLTPSHFLIGRPITSISEPNIIHIEKNRLNIYQRVTKIVQSIWKRWSNNY
ncbi:integrase catalytic domain-containing protein [Trichonephila clavipes]|nr:integrase catalytic domain-containing protein [Trichonephila clavipes]